MSRTSVTVPNAILPAQYKAACKAIAACRTIDESKNWADKADALATWAKVYKDDSAAIEAKRLKLHAFRRMSELADELQPQRYSSGPGTKGKTKLDGPRALLLEHGISRGLAHHIRRIGHIPPKKFQALIDAKQPPGIMRASELGRGVGAKARSSDAWRALVDGRQTASISLSRFVKRFCACQNPKKLARELWPDEVDNARTLIWSAIQWLEEFERNLVVPVQKNGKTRRVK